MSLPADIAATVEREFPDDHAAVVTRLLQLRAEDDQLFCYRILSCKVFGACYHPTAHLEH